MSADPVREAAQALLDQWDAPGWVLNGGHIGNYFGALRTALAAPPQSNESVRSSEGGEGAGRSNPQPEQVVSNRKDADATVSAGRTDWIAGTFADKRGTFAAPEGPAPEPIFGYTRTFNAIAAAVTWHEHKTFGISVKAFKEAFATPEAPPLAEARQPSESEVLAEIKRQRDEFEASGVIGQRIMQLRREDSKRPIDYNARYGAFCHALRTHAGDADGYEFGLARVKFNGGKPAEVLWATQAEIDEAVARAALASPAVAGERAYTAEQIGMAFADCAIPDSTFESVLMELEALPEPHLDHQVGAPVTPLPLDSAGGAVDDGRDTRAPMTEAQARDIWQQTSAEVAKMELEGRYYFASWALITIRLTEKFHGIAPPGAIDAAIAKEKQA